MSNITRTEFLGKRIVVGSETRALDTFATVCPDFRANIEQTDSEFVRDIWDRYSSIPARENSTNGKVFEHIISALLLRKNILPFYLQAKVAFVPNVDYDFLFYSREKGPIVISAKTTLRERYKQADLEAIALKYVHRKAESYLLTLDNAEANSVNNKIRNGEVIGINKVICCKNEEFDTFFDMLNPSSFERAGTIEIISGRVIENI
ncbi:MAG: hypothetical protein AB7U80_01960 [Wolinella sp.]